MISSESIDKKNWITDELFDMCDLKRKLKKNKFENGSTYKIINSQIKRAMKNAKEDWVNRKYKEIDTCFTHNNTKKAYQIVKDLTKHKQRVLTNIQNKYSNCINDKKGVIIRLTEYC